jgi:hypothetical protein
MLGTYKAWFWEVTKRVRFGVEYSRVHVGDEPYLDRYILYIGGPTLRLHKFYRGDDDRAPHDHPWTFWTFPFRTYWEKVCREDGSWYWNRVRAWTFNRRPATYRHIVVNAGPGPYMSTGPFWTFVVTGFSKLGSKQ